ncbi:protein translocase component YidC [Candidatus Parcubacteria bacterium]|jgi:YidC/Oxa1 family membrane protein insertase|nr:MAG: protein translocase component YidC [Candidatus Parcubacteria bacterium]
MNIFVTFLYDPLFNGLIFLYKYIPGHDLGVAIILLTLLIKALLFWPSLSAIHNQQKMQEIQPKLKELQEKYKDNKEELSRQLMVFYKQNKVNPFSSCLPLLLQLPILIALYKVFFAGINVNPATHLFNADQLSHLYPFLRSTFETSQVSTTFLGFLDLTAKHNIVLALLAGAAQFWQSKMMMSKKPPKVPGAKDEQVSAIMSTQMTYLLPAITVIFGYQFPAGLSLYWVASTLFQVAQQYYYFKWHKPKQSGQTPEVLPRA